MCRTVVLLLAWSSLWMSAWATYRSIHISNADVCRKKSKVSLPSFISSDSDAKKEEKLDIGEGAIIFQLKSPQVSLQPNIRNKREVSRLGSIHE